MHLQKELLVLLHLLHLLHLLDLLRLLDQQVSQLHPIEVPKSVESGEWCNRQYLLQRWCHSNRLLHLEDYQMRHRLLVLMEHLQR